MQNFVKILTGIAVAGGMTLSTAATGSAAVNPKCKAQFSKTDLDHDGRLNSSEFQKFKVIKSKVDVNHDGMISADEYIVACQTDLFKQIQAKDAPG